MRKVLSFLLCMMIMVSFALPVSALKSVRLKSISLDKSNITLDVGNTYSLKVTYTPANTTQKLLKFSTSNKNIATVDKKGKITAIKPGNAVITVTSSSNKKINKTFSVTVAAAAGWKDDISPITFTWFTNDGRVPSEWGKDEVTKYIKEKTGVTLEITQATGNVEEKINTMIASQMLPDFIELGNSMAQTKEIIKAGMVQPLNKLAEKFDPYFFKAADAQKLSWYKQEDGNTYGYPNFSYSIEDSKKGSANAMVSVMVRKDLYEALGKPDMRTPKGWLNAINAAKEKFPNGLNGQPLVPLGTSVWDPTWGNWALQGALFQLLSIPREKDGKYNVENGVIDPEYLIWLKTIRKANDMGLVSKEIFTDQAQQIAEKATNGRYFCFIGQRTSFTNANKELAKTNPESVYIAVDAMWNSKLEKPQLDGPNVTGWLLSMITSKNKNPERAIKFLSYLISDEGQLDLQLGKEGVSWQMSNKGPALMPAYQKLYKEDIQRFSKEFGGGTKYGFVMNPVIRNIWEGNVDYSDKPDPNLQPKLWTRKYSINVSPYFGIAPDAGSVEEKALYKMYEKFVLVQPKLITAKTEEEMMKLYNQFVKDYNEIMPVYNEFATKKLQENKVKLGIK